MLTILTNKYSPPILSGGGDLLLAGTARETTPFPVKSYDATVYVDLTIDDKTVAENIRLRMKDGNATFVEDIPLLEITNSVPNIPVTVTVKHAKWIPYGKASVQILGQ